MVVAYVFLLIISLINDVPGLQLIMCLENPQFLRADYIDSDEIILDQSLCPINFKFLFHEVFSCIRLHFGAI